MTSKVRVALVPRPHEPRSPTLGACMCSPRRLVPASQVGVALEPRSPTQVAMQLRFEPRSPTRMHMLTTAPRPSQVAMQLRFEQAADDDEPPGSADGAQSTEQPVVIEDAYAGSGGFEVL